jgi:hypothetical protein
MATLSLDLKLAAIPAPTVTVTTRVPVLGKPEYEVPKDLPALVEWGPGHSFAAKYRALVNGSPTAASVMRTRKRLMIGEGLSAVKNDKLAAYLSGTYGPQKNLGITGGIARALGIWMDDRAMYGVHAAVIIWGEGGKVITNIRPVAYHTVGLGEIDPESEAVEWAYVCRNWAKKNESKGRFPVYPIPLFDPAKAAQYPEQLYVSDIPEDYYPVPDLQSVLNAMETEALLGRYHANAVGNRFTGSTIVMVQDPPAEQDSAGAIVPQEVVRDRFVKSFKKKHTTEGDGDSIVFLFTSDPEKAAQILAVPQGATPEAFEYLENYTRRQILAAAQVANPAIVGIAEGGSLGGDASAARTAYEIMINTQAVPAQAGVLGSLREWVALSPAKTPEADELAINTAVPVRAQPSEDMVAQLLQNDDNAREYFGLSAYNESERAAAATRPPVTPVPANV